MLEMIIKVFEGLIIRLLTEGFVKKYRVTETYLDFSNDLIRTNDRECFSYFRLLETKFIFSKYERQIILSR